MMPGWDPTAASSGDSRVKLTYDDLMLLPDDGLRHELIDGEHYVTPSPIIQHQRVSRRLFLLMGKWLDEHRVGEVFYAPVDVVFSMFDVVEPDLLYISRERAAILTRPNVQGAPDLVIEIASPSTRQRDETIKRNLYEARNVTEYWFVDPEMDVIHVYRRSGERFAQPIELSHDNHDVLTTPLLPGLEIPLAKVFQD